MRLSLSMMVSWYMGVVTIDLGLLLLVKVCSGCTIGVVLFLFL